MNWHMMPFLLLVVASCASNDVSARAAPSPSNAQELSESNVPSACPAGTASLENMTMATFETKHLPMPQDAVAPDGSDVRVLLRLKGGSMAHFELGPGQTSRAVVHGRVEEIWFFLSGRGEMWRAQGKVEQTVDVYPGVCLTIPVGTRFQFRSFGYEPLAAVGVTMPPWPEEGDGTVVEGKWLPSGHGEAMH